MHEEKRVPEESPMSDAEPRTDPLLHDQRRARRPQTSRPLRRSAHGPIGGVATGIAEFIDAEPTRVRWIFGVSLPLTIGISGVAYLVLWMLLPGPSAPADPTPEDRAER
jgi:phage shock protein PspC (stress-responsive transcriptional regulator)